MPRQAYAAVDIDSPGAAVVAVAWKADDGWRVGVDGGSTVADGLTERRALNLMHTTASRELDRARVVLADVSGGTG